MSDLAAALLRVPPFPGARPVTIIGSGTANVDPGEVIAAMRRARVGGAFWGADDPWTLFDRGETLAFGPDDPLALLAAIAGCRVDCAGRFAALADGGLEDLVYCELASLAYRNPYTGEPIGLLDLIEILGFWRQLIENNRHISAAFGFAAWKQDTVAALLWPGTGPASFAAASRAALDRLPPGAAVAVWKARVPPAFLAELEASGRPIIEVEDGFIRSIGLGADCVPPLSIVLDDLGAHYDPSHTSRLEAMIAGDEPDAATLARARALRERIAATGISKYGVGGTILPRPAGDRRHVLVVGQVEDDRSVRLGGCGLQSNHALLARVRARCPDAYIVYRPHPDVEAGHRKGHVPPAAALRLADAIDPGNAISDLIAMVDEVHVITSLAGFEALLHGKHVVTHGVPFYAGWGLTEDLGPVPARRGCLRSLDALVAAVLLGYPRYLDPVTGLPCNAEILALRLGDGVQRKNAALVTLRRGIGKMGRWLSRVREKI